jgi:MFS family permease
MKNLLFLRTFNVSYGWLLVGALTLVMIGFYGAHLSFGVLLKPILTEFDWTRAITSGAMSTSAGLAGLLGVLTGRLTDKYGPRVLLGAGALLSVVGFLLMSRMNSIWQLYIYFGVIVGISFAACWTPINATVSRWFSRQRVLALGIVTSGITLGHMVIPPLVALFIDAHGWRFAYLMLAILVLISVIPALTMLGRNPLQDRQFSQNTNNSAGNINDRVATQPELSTWTISEAAKTVPFQMLMVTGFVTAAGFYFIAVHIVAYATDIGIDAPIAALILTFMGGANILGKLLMPPVVAKIGGRFSLLSIFALLTITLFLLMWANSLWTFFLLSSLFGFGFGASSPIRMAMISEFFGLRSIGTMIGIVELAWAAGAISGPVMAGYVFDVSGSYDIAFAAGGLLMLTGTVAAYFLKKPVPPFRIHDR